MRQRGYRRVKHLEKLANLLFCGFADLRICEFSPREFLIKQIYAFPTVSGR
jgi:hypothetical protein